MKHWSPSIDVYKYSDFGILGASLNFHSDATLCFNNIACADYSNSSDGASKGLHEISQMEVPQ